VRLCLFVSAALLAGSVWAAGPPFDSKASVITPCGTAPNCVSSDATDEGHAIEALKFTGPAAKAWRAAKEALLSLPRTKIINENDRTLHAECTSALFRFVDDVEFELRAEQGIIAVRSASRVGYSDLGVNRRRIESVRAAFIERMKLD